MVFKGNESKEHLLAKGMELVWEFSQLNSIPHPSIFVNNDLSDDCYGVIYHTSVIHINMKLCRPPAKTPGYSWTFPGYVQDLTPYGIIAHEFGHYISDILGKDFRKNFINMKKREDDVTSLDKMNLDERMAEAARLFITNPDLLKRGRPNRYDIFAKHYKPVVKKKWKTILKNAHPKIIVAAENWIQKNK